MVASEPSLSTLSTDADSPMRYCTTAFDKAGIAGHQNCCCIMTARSINGQTSPFIRLRSHYFDVAMRPSQVTDNALVIDRLLNLIGSPPQMAHSLSSPLIRPIPPQLPEIGRRPMMTPTAMMATKNANTPKP